MDKKYVELQFGYGSKTHAGVKVQNGTSEIVLALCGSRKSGTSKRVMGEANAATFIGLANACEKCLEKVSNINSFMTKNTK